MAGKWEGGERERVKGLEGSGANVYTGVNG